MLFTNRVTLSHYYRGHVRTSSLLFPCVPISLLSIFYFLFSIRRWEHILRKSTWMTTTAVRPSIHSARRKQWKISLEMLPANSYHHDYAAVVCSCRTTACFYSGTRKKHAMTHGSGRGVPFFSPKDPRLTCFVPQPK